MSAAVSSTFMLRRFCSPLPPFGADDDAEVVDEDEEEVGTVEEEGASWPWPAAVSAAKGFRRSAAMLPPIKFAKFAAEAAKCETVAAAPTFAPSSASEAASPASPSSAARSRSSTAVRTSETTFAASGAEANPMLHTLTVTVEVESTALSASF